MLSKLTQTSEDLIQTSTELKMEKTDEPDLFQIWSDQSKSTQTFITTETLTETEEIDNNDFHLVNDHTDDLAAGPINILGLTELTDDEIRTLSMRELNQRLKELRCTKE